MREYSHSHSDMDLRSLQPACHLTMPSGEAAAHVTSNGVCPSAHARAEVVPLRQRTSDAKMIDLHVLQEAKPLGAAPGKPIQGPALWYAKDYQEKPELWAYCLTPADIDELNAAVAKIASSQKDLKDVGKQDFGLPNLGPKLSAFCKELNEGKGFQVIRGIPVGQYSTEESVIAFWCIGLYFGRARPQNRRQHLLGHVKDIRLPGGASNPVNRTYATSAAQPWHVDECDIVGLLCLKTAKEGGHSQWACSASIHNEMLEKTPELYQELCSPLWVDRKNEVPPGKLPYYQMPVFNFHQGRMAAYYVSSYYQVCQRHFPATPRLTDKQHAAFAMFDATASRPDIAMDWILEPGDMQFLQNHLCVHNRTSFQDHDDEEKRRHLLRLWLSPEEGWELPSCYAERYGSIEVGDRGGIWMPGASPHVPIDPRSGL